MSKCDVCINKKYCANHLDARTMCPQTDYVLFTPSYKTNYDLLISKTPEELAELFSHLCCPYSLGGNVDCNAESKGCYECWLDWLKAPVEDMPHED